jgi:hypothetical protein
LGGGTSSAAKVALAGVVGLLLVGLVLFGVSTATGRRNAGTTTGTEGRATPAKTKVKS